MARRRPKGVLEITWAVAESAAWGRTEHVPVSGDYPDHVVRRTTFSAGGGLGWRLSAIESPREKLAPWKIVVVTGAPSWAEYWAPAIAALPQDREMVVVDRPGYAGSEPVEYVGDIGRQALALSPLLRARPGQKILLVGQSYGAAIATLMAASNPGKVAGLVLLSGYYGQPGPTAAWLL
ncbi:MAG: alpha/beta hydrolase, partial [Pseudomonadota bacterium]